jgi:hypothetical protein
MKLLEIVKGLEGKDDRGRREATCGFLKSFGIDYFRSDYRGGQNIIVCSGKEREIGISSHFDVVSGSPGANDNASAVAVCLDVLKRVKESPLANIGVRGLIFDEEELNLKGSAAYVKSGGRNGLIGLYNMELVGRGDRIALWCEGELHEGLLLMTIESQARAKGIESYRFPQISRFLYNGGDHRSFNEAGMSEAFCITTISEGDVEIAKKYFTGSFEKDDLGSVVAQAPLFRHYHQSTDASEHLSEQTLQMVSDLLFCCICEIDRRDPKM